MVSSEAWPLIMWMSLSDFGQGNAVGLMPPAKHSFGQGMGVVIVTGGQPTSPSPPARGMMVWWGQVQF